MSPPASHDAVASLLVGSLVTFQVNVLAVPPGMKMSRYACHRAKPVDPLTVTVLFVAWKEICPLFEFVFKKRGMQSPSYPCPFVEGNGVLEIAGGAVGMVSTLEGDPHHP